jgi:single-strand DNA-binding protein
VVLVGRLTAEPELRFTPAGVAVCNLRLATNERDEPEYHDLVVWRELAQICAAHLSKGRLIYVEGRLHSHTWQAQDGSTRRSVEVAADEIQFLAPKPMTEPAPGGDGAA